MTTGLAHSVQVRLVQHAKKLGIDLTGLDHLAAFHQRMSADPGVQAALKAEGLL